MRCWNLEILIFFFRRVPAGVRRGVGAPQRLFFFLARRRRPLDEEFQFGLAFKLPSKFGTHVDDPKGDFLFSDSKRLKNPKKIDGGLKSSMRVKGEVCKLHPCLNGCMPPGPFKALKI